MTTNHGRRARGVGRDRQNAGLTQQTATVTVRAQRHSPKTTAVNVPNSVVPRQSLVQVGVICLQQIKYAAIFPHDAVKKQFRLCPHGLPQVVVEVWKTTHDPDSRNPDFADTAIAQQNS